MIVAFVTFKLSEPCDLDEMTKTFQGTAPRYQGLPGLLRKNYWVSEDRQRVGGIYVWESREAAEKVYTTEWEAMVTEKYGLPPVLVYMDSPVMVDNRDGSISVAA